MSDAGRAFGALVREFYEVWFRFHPERAIDAGVSGFEGRLPAFDDDDIGALTGWLETAIVELEELDGGQLLARSEQASGLEGLITSVAYSPQGSLLAAVSNAGDPRVAVWDVMRFRDVWRASADHSLNTGYLVPGGRLLAGISQGDLTSRPQMTVLELETNRIVSQVDAPGVPLDWTSFSPNGEWLAVLRTSDGDNMLAFLTSAGTAAPSEIVLHRFPENGRRARGAGRRVYGPDRARRALLPLSRTA